MKFLLQFLLLITVVHFSAPLLAQKEGKKKRVAVFIFDDKTDNGRSWWGQRTVGEGMSDMVITELVKTGQYTVLERQELDELLREQDLGASGIVTPESAAEIGKVLGVELAVMGAVTEFGYNKSDTDVRVDRTRVGLGMQSAAVGMDVRMVNTSTGEIIAAENIRKTKRAPSASVSRGSIGFENENEFNQSIVGKAARNAIEDVVGLVTKNSDKVSWAAKVVTEASGKVYINSGARDGVQVGETFTVYRPGEELVDPDTGLSLGTVDSKVGQIKVVDNNVGDGKASICSIQSGSGYQRGDVVKEE